MLIHENRLIAALARYDARNGLMNELTINPHLNPNKNFYEQALAFWLGSNVTLVLMQHHGFFRNCYEYLYHGYSCFLIFDRNISLIADKNSKAFRQLADCRFNMFRYFNENYELLISEPAKLFEQFKLYVDEIGDDLAPDDKYYQLVVKTKEECQQQIVFRTRDNMLGLAAKSSAEQAVLQPASVNFSNQSAIGLFATKWITQSLNNHAFYQQYNYEQSVLKVATLLLPAKDGVLLEGLFVGKKENPTKNIVIALIGHFQSLDSYLDVFHAMAFQKMFGCDLVLVNHRNYSTRAGMQADNADVLADDVNVFVDHFRKKGRGISLYGMCGGAAHMLLAAKKLTQNNIRYKLIIDRFPSSYADFFSKKTVDRRLHIESLNNNLSWKEYFRVKALLVAFNLVAPLILRYMNNDFNFADILRELPENDVLVLQACSKKKENQQEPQCIDVVVHPDNDIRDALKDRRHAKKVLLKNLSSMCLEISNEVVQIQPLRKVFVELKIFFDNCLHLIQDEKLQLPCEPYSVTDLHSNQLYDLTTRNYMPISRFLNGFFANDAFRWKKIIKQLSVFKEFEVCMLLFINNDRGFDRMGGMSRLIYKCLQTMVANSEYITHMASRVCRSKMGDLNVPLRELLELLCPDEAEYVIRYSRR